jgi:hypothetical protein
MEARASRLERYHTNDKSTIEKTIIHVPQPKNLVKNKGEKTIVKSKSPKVAVEVKRGRGRPRKETTENIVSTSKKATGSNKKQTKLVKGRK